MRCAAAGSAARDGRATFLLSCEHVRWQPRRRALCAAALPPNVARGFSDVSYFPAAYATEGRPQCAYMLYFKIEAAEKERLRRVAYSSNSRASPTGVLSPLRSLLEVCLSSTLQRGVLSKQYFRTPFCLQDTNYFLRSRQTQRSAFGRHFFRLAFSNSSSYESSA